MRFTYALLLSLLGCGPYLGAQEAPPESEKASLFTYGVTVSTQYDDELGQGTTNGRGDVIYYLQPEFGFDIKRSRWQSTLEYLPAVTYSTQRRSSYDLFSHTLSFALTHQFTKRLTFDVHNDFTLTNNPFDNLRANSELQQIDPLNRPNTSVSGTILSRRMEQVDATVAYALSRRASFGVSGNFMHSDYREAVQSGFEGSLQTISKSGEAFYSYQTGPRTSMGLRYRYDALDFGHGAVKTDAHSLLYSWDIAFKPSLAFSLFAGPNYSDTRQSPVISGSAGARSLDWSGVGGATLNWKGQRHEFIAGATRQISDGGGTRGNVRLDSYNLRISRQIRRHFNVSTYAVYNHNHLLLPVDGGSSSFDYLGAGAEFGRDITEHTSLGLFYLRVQQNGDHTVSSFSSGNRVGIRLSYRKQRPIGR